MLIADSALPDLKLYTIGIDAANPVFVIAKHLLNHKSVIVYYMNEHSILVS